LFALMVQTEFCDVRLISDADKGLKPCATENRLLFLCLNFAA
jgi:hypothetical protein